MKQYNLILEKLNKIERLIKAQNLNQKEILTFNEACEFMCLSSSWLYKLTSGGQIPYLKPAGKKIYFERIELIQWLKRNRHSSNSELADLAINRVTRN